jgi:ABC-type transporter Mla subunit MlaD
MTAGPMQRPTRGNDIAMWVILLEALGALALLVLIVWWTMFSGRKGGERRRPEDR